MPSDAESRNYSILSTILIHIGIAALLFFITMDTALEEQEFSELAFSSFVNSPVINKNEKKAPSTRQMERMASNKSRDNKPSDIVDLPDRKLKTPEPPEIKRARKDRVQTNDNPFNVAANAERPGNQLVQSDSLDKAGLKDGEREQFNQQQLSVADRTDRKLPSAEEGGGFRSGKAFSIDWLGGGVREKLSGALPTYPQGLNQEAKILLRFIVKPDGSVGNIIPEKKGNTVLENISIQALRNWRFNKLEAQVPQINQEGIISFIFKLK